MDSQPPLLPWPDPFELAVASANGTLEYEPLGNVDSVRLLRVPPINVGKSWIACDLFETDIEAFANEEGSGLDRTFCAI